MPRSLHVHCPGFSPHVWGSMIETCDPSFYAKRSGMACFRYDLEGKDLLGKCYTLTSLDGSDGALLHELIVYHVADVVRTQL